MTNQIATGCPELDVLELGYPIGKTSFIAGEAAVGASTLALKGVYAALDQGLSVYWADWEHDRHKPHRRLTFAMSPSREDLGEALQEKYDLFVLDGYRLLPGPASRPPIAAGQTVILTWQVRRLGWLTQELALLPGDHPWWGDVGQILLITREERKSRVTVYREGVEVCNLPVANLDWLGREHIDAVITP